MKKKILSVILTIAMILSTLSVPMAVFADSNTVQYHTGDYTFNFDNESDVLKTVNGNVDTQSGVLALHNGTGSDAEISATLNYQLKSNSTYSFEVKMSAAGESSPNWITPKLYAANSTGVNDSVLFTIPGYGLTPSSTSATIRTGTFTTGELTADNDLLEFYMWVGATYTYTYNIDYIKIYDESEYPVNTGNYTFDFDTRKKDTVTVTNGYVANGKLVTKDGKAAWNNLTAILNYKLESNKSYVYEIIGNVSGYSSGSVQAFFTLASKTAADTSSGKLINLYYPNNISGWATPSNGAFTFKGKFNTNNLSDGNDYLAIYLNDGTNAKFEFEKIKIIEVNSGDYVFNFDNEDDVLKTVNGSIDTQNGVVALHNGTGSDAEISATLNYQLKSNTKYSYEVKMTASGEATSNWITPKFYASNLSLNNPQLCVFGGYGLTPSSTSATIKTGTFTTGELMTGVDLLTFYMWVGASYTYTYNIDYIKIYDETEYPANTGNYTFDFDVRKKDTLSVTNGYVAEGKLVTKDGKAPWNNLTAILNYNLESNKTYAYEIIGNVSGYTNNASLQAVLTSSSATTADTANGKLRNLYYSEALTGWATPKNGDFTFTGTFTTGDLNDENNYIALYLNDGTDAKFEFESFKIIEKLEPAAPSGLAVVSANSRSITLTAIDGCEYSYNGKVWQDSPVMTGYGTGKITFYARVKETMYNVAGESATVEYTVHRAGDVDGDGNISATDLVAMRKHLLGTAVEISETGSDVNEDGTFNILDLVRLKKTIVNLGLTVTFGSNTYTLDYYDDFSGTELSSRWIYNTEYETTVEDATLKVDNTNVSVSNGVLSLGTSKDDNGVYHGCDIRTTDTFSHGYFEAKVKIPAGTGYFPAFWGKMPKELSDKPYNNEIDFFEFFGTDQEFYPAIHTWFDPQSENLPEWIENRNTNDPRVNDNEFVFALPYNPIAFSNVDEYHIFGCEWTSDKIAIYLDGVKCFEKFFEGDYDVALIAGDPIYIYFDILLGPDYLPESDNIGNSFDIEYFRYYKPSK